MKSLKLLASVLSLSLVLFACAAPKIDPMSMQVTPADTEQVNIPQICMAQYESKKISVAVLPFTNNTTFGKMEGVNTNIQGEATRTHTSAGVAGVVAAPGAVGIGYAGASKTNVKYSKDINTFYRQISPQLGEFAQSAVEDTIVNIGGVNVFSRAQMEKILQEQGFQMNVADPNTVAQFGKIAGVSYVITGTVDNINAKYVPKSDTNTGNVWVNLALAVGKSMVEGWNVTTDMTVQLIDVSTGQILLSKKVSGRELGGTQPGFNPELVVTAAKKAMQESVDDIKPVFSEHFSAKAYINQLRGNKSAAMVSMGRKDGIKPGDKLEAYEFLEVQDFMTKKSNCTKSKIPVELIVSDQVDESTSWVVVEGEPNSKMRLKLGTLVKRAPMSGQSVIKKLW
jgi:curli biogenesis system outer membrane secretion channel CsgG